MSQGDASTESTIIIFKSMTIQEAIKKAKDNGYIEGATDGEGVDAWPEVAFLDPGFWQSLGKAMVWGKKGRAFCMMCRQVAGWEHDHSDLRCLLCGANAADYLQEIWKAEWHYFIDHLTDGKTAEDYFKTLA